MAAAWNSGSWSDVSPAAQQVQGSWPYLISCGSPGNYMAFTGRLAWEILATLRVA